MGIEKAEVHCDIIVISYLSAIVLLSNEYMHIVMLRLWISQSGSDSDNPLHRNVS